MRRRAPSLTTCLWLFVLVALLAGAWLAVRGYQVRSNLLSARAELGRVSLAQLDALPNAAKTTGGDVRAARKAVDDPLWRLAAAVPVAGRTFAVARDAVRTSEILVTGVLPPLLRAGQAVQQQPVLDDGRVDLGLLRTLEPSLQEAAAAAASSRAAADRTSAALLPPPVRRLRADLIGETERLAGALASARTATALAPAMLGADRPRRYFLAVQNNAEVRGTGGLVGAYAVLRADNGVLTRERSGTNRDFETAPAPVVDLGPEFSDRYDVDSARTYWSAAVLTPHWPSAAAIMAGLWEQQGGGPIDGVLGVDPVAMAQILAVTGPAQVEGRAIGAKNVVDFVMRDEYAEFEGAEGERQEVLAELAEALYDKIVGGGYDSARMLRALAVAGSSGHLKVWSATPSEQEVLAPFRVSGALPAQPGPYLHVVMNNAAGNKADYYLRRRVAYERTGEGRARVQVTLTNLVEPATVPPIVIGRLDEPDEPVEPGATRLILSLFVGVGQEVGSVQVNGRDVLVRLDTEQGHGVATVLVEVAPSAPTVVAAELTDPGGVLTYRQQPLVVDDELDLGVPYVVD